MPQPPPMGSQPLPRLALLTTALAVKILCTGVSGVHYPHMTGAELHAVWHFLSITHNRIVRVEVTALGEEGFRRVRVVHGSLDQAMRAHGGFDHNAHCLRTLMRLATRVSSYAPTHSNQVTLYRDEARFIDIVSKSIELARSHVHLAPSRQSKVGKT